MWGHYWRKPNRVPYGVIVPIRFHARAVTARQSACFHARAKATYP
jgi:hypothetical protein